MEQQRQRRRREPRQQPLREAYSFEPVGHIESCFRRLRAIPRQGALAPATRARLVLRPSVQSCTVDELERFSHVWVLFVFHDNTSSDKARPAHQVPCRVLSVVMALAMTRTKSGGDPISERPHPYCALPCRAVLCCFVQSYRAKVAPPKLGRRVGVFATRSPHRPNSIGQTVVRYEGLERFQLPPTPAYSKPRWAHALRLSGVDFVDGTPVLDVKPYVAAYDCVPAAAMAPWVEAAAAPETAAAVSFSEGARGQVRESWLTDPVIDYLAPRAPPPARHVPAALSVRIRCWHVKQRKPDAPTLPRSHATAHQWPPPCVCLAAARAAPAHALLRQRRGGGGGRAAGITLIQTTTACPTATHPAAPADGTPISTPICACPLGVGGRCVLCAVQRRGSACPTHSNIDSGWYAVHTVCVRCWRLASTTAEPERGAPSGGRMWTVVAAAAATTPSAFRWMAWSSSCTGRRR